MKLAYLHQNPPLKGFAPKDAAWKTELFRMRYFLKMKHQSTKTIITEQCFSCQNKSASQKLA